MKSATIATFIWMATLATSLKAEESRYPGVQTTLQLPASSSNPRNSEGDFVQLKDGRWLFIYTHFTGGVGDHAAAHLAGRQSDDGGRSWTTKDRIVLESDAGKNIMSVSLLRMTDGRIAMFYLRKESLKDCRPWVRFSHDEAATWSEPQQIIPDEEVGYYVLNNDRVIQLDSGRLLVPVAKHMTPNGEADWTGKVLCYLSDDDGRTWKRSRSILEAREEATDKRRTAQEPGVVGLRDGRIMMFVRSDAGSQWVSFSGDEGESWSKLEPSTLRSPLSPATIERVPGTGILLCVWNDHRKTDPQLAGKRTPLSMAISRDDGTSWEDSITLFDNPNGWYCYTAIDFSSDAILLGHCAGDRTRNNGLAESQVTRVPLRSILSPADE